MILPDPGLSYTEGGRGGPASGSQDDNEYDLCFVVEEVEYLTFKQGFIVHSPYLRELIENLVMG
jgi:hypothetical protein